MKIVFIGAGNLATNLAKALYKKDYNILQVYSRTETSAKQLADQIEANFTNNDSDIYNDADIYFIAVKDDAIETILSSFSNNDKLLVHCSGSTSIEILSKFSNKYGVFYPLQTFSKSKEINFDSIPIFLEANDDRSYDKLEKIAQSLSQNVQSANSEQRLALHIAAVFSCNFVNYLYSVSANILEHQQLDFQNLLPLIKETADKVRKLHPVDAQTGPAVRYDKNIIDKHLLYLKDNPELYNIYKELSEQIYNQQKNKI